MKLTRNLDGSPSKEDSVTLYTDSHISKTSGNILDGHILELSYLCSFKGLETWEPDEYGTGGHSDVSAA